MVPYHLPNMHLWEWRTWEKPRTAVASVSWAGHFASLSLHSTCTHCHFGAGRCTDFSPSQQACHLFVGDLLSSTYAFVDLNSFFTLHVCCLCLPLSCRRGDSGRHFTCLPFFQGGDGQVYFTSGRRWIRRGSIWQVPLGYCGWGGRGLWEWCLPSSISPGREKSL